MRKIKISIIPNHDSLSSIKDEKLYSFILPNGANVAIGKKRDFEKFVSESERMFTNLIYEFNEIMIDLFAEYRVWYLNLSIEEEISFENNFSEIKRIMNKSFKAATYGNNGIHYLHKDSKDMANLLLKLLNLLEKLMKRMVNFSKTKKYAIIRERIETLLLRLKNWGWQHHKPWGKFKEFNISYYENEYFKSYELKPT